MGNYPEHLLEVIAAEQDYDLYYNRGDDCDFCKNQYLCGLFGDSLGCRLKDKGLDCKFEVDDNIFNNRKGE